MRIALDAQDIKALVRGQLVEKEVINREGDVEQVQIVVHDSGWSPTASPMNPDWASPPNLWTSRQH